MEEGFSWFRNNFVQREFNWTVMPEVAKAPVTKLGVLLGSLVLIGLQFVAEPWPWLWQAGCWGWPYSLLRLPLSLTEYWGCHPHL